MFGIVINEDCYKVEFVALNEDKTPQFYTLNEDETIIEDGWQIANSLLKAKWTGSEWVEGATEQESKEWEEAQPKPPTPIKTNEELQEENKLLKAQVEALSLTADFHEELIAEIATMLYA